MAADGEHRYAHRVNSTPLIAIVDDEECVRRALDRLMRSAGYRAHTFESGAELLNWLDHDPPACLILDLHMMPMSGFDILKAIGQRQQRIPVVVITGRDTPEAFARATSAGASAYLRKPVDDTVLLEAVGKALTRTTKGVI